MFPSSPSLLFQVAQDGVYHRIEKMCLGEEARKKVILGIMSDK